MHIPAPTTLKGCRVPLPAETQAGGCLHCLYPFRCFSTHPEWATIDPSPPPFSCLFFCVFLLFFPIKKSWLCVFWGGLDFGGFQILGAKRSNGGGKRFGLS